MKRGAGQTRFALLCHQRSGSNALTSLLQQHDDVAMYGQLFNDGLEYRRHHDAAFGLPLFRPHPDADLHHGPAPPLRRRLEKLALRFVDRAEDVEDYADAFFTRFGAAADVVGCKVHDFQLVDEDLAAFLGRLDRVVVLTRRNLLRAAVSWAVALRSDLWVAQRGSDERQDPVTLDPDQVAWFIDKTRTTVATWQRLVADTDTPPLWLTYEDHVQERRFDGLWSHLDVAPLEADFTTRKLARGYDHVANAEELEERFGSDDTGHLLDVV